VLRLYSSPAFFFLLQKIIILKCNKILLQQCQEIIRIVRIRCSNEGTTGYVGAVRGGRQIDAYIPLHVCQVFQIERSTFNENTGLCMGGYIIKESN
jgi:hypothetical protein